MTLPALKHPASGFALESLPLAGPVSPVPRRELMSNSSVPRGRGLFEVTRTGVHGNAGRSFITNVRRLAGKERTPGSMVIMAMTWLLVVLDAGLLYVSFAAQYKFVFTEKGQRVPSAIEAGMLDVGMVLLSGLGIGLALAGKPSKSVRFLIMVCAAASAGMNFADAAPGSWKSVAAYVAVPVFLAVITDRVIAVIRQHVLPLDAESAWMPLGRFLLAGCKVCALVLLYLLRVTLAPGQTLTGLRRMVLDAAPVPGITGVEAEPAEPELMPGPDLRAGVFFRAHGGITPHLTLDHDGQLIVCTACPLDVADDEEPPEFGSKREAFEWHYRRHPQFGDREAMSQVARLVGEAVGLQWGTSRTYAAAILAADAISDAMDAARDEEAQ